MSELAEKQSDIKPFNLRAISKRPIRNRLRGMNVPVRVRSCRRSLEIWWRPVYIHNDQRDARVYPRGYYIPPNFRVIFSRLLYLDAGFSRSGVGGLAVWSDEDFHFRKMKSTRQEQRLRAMKTPTISLIDMVCEYRSWTGEKRCWQDSSGISCAHGSAVDTRTSWQVVCTLYGQPLMYIRSNVYYYKLIKIVTSGN
jgi:hypothetical protein